MGAIYQGLLRVGVNFNEQPISPSGYCRLTQRRYQRRVASHMARVDLPLM